MSRRKLYQQSLNVVSLYRLLWIFGAVLVVLSWVRVVSPLIGWIGFFIAGAATVTSIIFNLIVERRRRSIPVAGSTRPTAVTFTEGLLQISLADGRAISAPLAWYPELAEASAEERACYELDSNGIYWPELDVDVSVLDVLDGARPPNQ